MKNKWLRHGIDLALLGLTWWLWQPVVLSGNWLIAARGGWLRLVVAVVALIVLGANYHGVVPTWRRVRGQWLPEVISFGFLIGIVSQLLLVLLGGIGLLLPHTTVLARLPVATWWGSFWALALLALMTQIALFAGGINVVFDSVKNKRTAAFLAGVWVLVVYELIHLLLPHTAGGLIQQALVTLVAGSGFCYLIFATKTWVWGWLVEVLCNVTVLPQRFMSLDGQLYAANYMTVLFVVASLIMAALLAVWHVSVRQLHHRGLAWLSVVAMGVSAVLLGALWWFIGPFNQM